MKLDTITADNTEVLRIYKTLLEEGMPKDSADIISDIVREGGVSEEEAYSALLAVLCGFDSEENEHDRRIEREYFSQIKKLSPRVYENDPYYKNIVFPRVKSGRWSFGRESYAPYEPFVWRDIVLTRDLREIPQIGFFSEPFSFPAVFEDGREWMAIKPNEIETMRAPLDAVSGDVLTYGLGLGYFAYMASRKEDVKSVTVVERDGKLIELFVSHLLPQFEHAEKINIVRADAYDFAENEMPRRTFDYVFADLWHDAADGFDAYIKLKRLEKKNAGAKYLYWIEDTLVSQLRFMVYNALKEKGKSEREILPCLDPAYLKKLAYDIKKA